VGDAGCLGAAGEVVAALREAAAPEVAAVPVLVGGPATDASVVAELGADGWAPDATAAADLIGQLRP